MWTGKLSWGIISRSNFVKVFTSYYKYRPGHLGACTGTWGRRNIVPSCTFFPSLLHSTFLFSVPRSHQYLPTSVNPNNSDRKITRSFFDSSLSSWVVPGSVGSSFLMSAESTALFYQRYRHPGTCRPRPGLPKASLHTTLQSRGCWIITPYSLST